MNLIGIIITDYFKWFLVGNNFSYVFCFMFLVKRLIHDDVIR